jgi:hypothetical protein
MQQYNLDQALHQLFSLTFSLPTFLTIANIIYRTVVRGCVIGIFFC